VNFDISNDFMMQAIQQWHLRIPAKLESAVLKRQAEFLAGRRAAQLALKQASPEYLNKEYPQLDQDEKGRPLWPMNFVGSISHSSSAQKRSAFAVACAAPTNQYQSLGIDIEYWVKSDTAEKLSTQILLPQERQRLALELPDIAILFTLVFAAKESLYKLLNPLTHVFFGFHDAHCTSIDLDNNLIELALLNPVTNYFPTGCRFQGRFEFCEQHVLCLLALPSQN
jgi:enterobactin synthetase component D